MKKLILSVALIISAYLNTKAQSLDFDGNDDYIDIGTAISTTSGYTKEAWIFATDVSGPRNIISSNSSPLWIDNGKLSVAHDFGGGSSIEISDPAPITLNVWTHVAVTYDAASTTLILYKNGIQVAINTSIAPYVAENIQIGAFNTGSFFMGHMDEVRLWDIARTPAQILDNMNCSIATATDLIASYNFNEGVPNSDNTAGPINVLFDNTGNTNDGTLNNFTLNGTTSNWVDNVTTLNPVASASIISNASTVCAGSSVSFTATPTNGGSAPSYQWMKNGVNVGTDSIGYTDNTLSSTDVISCMISSSISCATNVLSNTLSISVPSITIAGTTTLCYGDNTTLTASGLTSYTWSANAGSATTNTVNISPTNTDTYTVSGDDGTCMATNTVVVTVNTIPTVTITGTTTICSGNNTTLTASGLTSYTWSANAGSVITNTASVNPTATDTYVVSGDDGNCPATGTVVVNVNPTPTVTITATATSVCLGNNTILTASGLTSYTWSANAGSATTNTVDITPGATDTYTVSGDDGVCPSAGTISINVTNTPTITVTGNTNICAGQTTTLTAHGAVNYTWTPGNSHIATIHVPALTTSTSFSLVGSTNGCLGALYTGTINVTPTPTISISGTTTLCVGDNVTLDASGATTYTWSANAGSATTSSVNIMPGATDTYTVTGASGSCTTNTTVAVSVNSLPSLSVSGLTVCAGNTTTLTATGANTYTWSTTETTASITATPTATTTDYTVMGTDGNNCTGATIATVTVNPLPTITVNSATICPGATTTLTANGAVTYTWSTTETTTSIVTPTATATMDYTVTGEDANNCINTTIATVIVSQPTVSVNSATICPGGTATLTANGAVTYTWSTTETTTSIVTPTATATMDYTVTGEDANNCTNTAIATVTVSQPTVSVNNATICSGGTATLTANGAVTYTWSTTETTTSIVTPTATATMDYTVTGEDANNCTNTAIATVTVSQPTVTVNSVAICAGGTATLTANGATTYTWSTTETTASISPTPTATTTDYTVTGSDANNCTDMAVATITVNPTPNITFNVSPNTFCTTDPAAALTASPSGGSFTGTGVSGGMFDPATAGVGTFTITYSYTDANTCSATQDASVTVQNCGNGINQVSNNNAISTYPNPTSSDLFIQTSTSFDNATVEVYSMLGQKVLTAKLQDNVTRLSLGNLNNAVYQVRVFNNTTLIYQSKIVKQQ